jgi:hypothetical protein
MINLNTILNTNNLQSDFWTVNAVKFINYMNEQRSEWSEDDINKFIEELSNGSLKSQILIKDILGMDLKKVSEHTFFGVISTLQSFILKSSNPIDK